MKRGQRGQPDERAERREQGKEGAKLDAVANGGVGVVQGSMAGPRGPRVCVVFLVKGGGGGVFCFPQEPTLTRTSPLSSALHHLPLSAFFPSSAGTQTTMLSSPRCRPPLPSPRARPRHHKHRKWHSAHAALGRGRKKRLVSIRFHIYEKRWRFPNRTFYPE